MQLFTNSTEKTIASTRIYKQHDGVVVGTLLYPILGNIFLNSNYAIMDKSDSSCVLPDSLQPLLQISGRHFHQFYTSDYKPQKFLSYFEKQTP